MNTLRLTTARWFITKLHFIQKNKKKQKEMLYYVTLLDCTDCTFETTVYTSLKEAEAYFTQEKNTILSQIAKDSIYTQTDYFLETYSFVLKLGIN